MRVLVVEDEPILADSVAEWLRRESFAVDTAYDGETALDKFAINAYDAVVLDRDLPKVHGDDVCRAILDSGSHARVLMLTAASAVRARVEGLAIGADDYLTKPFAMVELSARVHALARRAVAPVQPVLERAGVRLDPQRRQVTRDGTPIVLANREFAVLTELLRADGAIVSAETLLEKAWDENIDPFTNTVRVAVMKLRRNLGDLPIDIVGRGLPVATGRGMPPSSFRHAQGKPFRGILDACPRATRRRVIGCLRRGHDRTADAGGRMVSREAPHP